MARVNAYRRRVGLAPLLTVDGRLARAHAEYLDLNRPRTLGALFDDKHPVDSQVESSVMESWNGNWRAGCSLTTFGPMDAAVDYWMASLHGRCAILPPNSGPVNIGHTASAPNLPDRARRAHRRPPLLPFPHAQGRTTNDRLPGGRGDRCATPPRRRPAERAPEGARRAII